MMYHDLILRLPDRTESESIALQDKILMKYEEKYSKSSLDEMMPKFKKILPKLERVQEHIEVLEQYLSETDKKLIKLKIKEHKQIIKYEILRVEIRKKAQILKEALEV